MPSPKPSKIKERAIQLAKTLGVRGVAEQLAKEGFGKVGKSAVAEWLRTDRELRAAGVRPGAPRRATGSPGRAPISTGTPEALEDEDDAPTPPAASRKGLPPELVGIDPSELDFHELEALDRQVTSFLGEAFRERNERRYVPLGRFKMELRTALNKLRPLPKVDPGVDPANLEAREAVLARIKKMIENAAGAGTMKAAP